MIDRYQSQKMKSIWSLQNKFDKMLEVEIAVCKAYAEEGLVPLDDLNNIIKNASFTIEEIEELEKVTKHDVVAFTRAISKNLGKEKKWIHYSLTSTDVVDTTNALLIKDANNLISLALDKFINVVKDLAHKYKYTYIMGRTHGMHAEITTFGFKWCIFYDELLRDKERFEKARKLIERGKISGAVGNYANTSIALEKRVCELLGIGVASMSTQVISRDTYCEYITSLAFIASTLEKIATEVRSLSRQEIHEVEEGFSKGQKGSSAMPHKRNPITSENICGCSRVVRSYISVAFENNILWHERDISHSSTERIILPDITSLVEYMLNRYASTLANLTVFENKMLENIELTKGMIYSGNILTRLLSKDISREDAYDLIQSLTKKAYEENLNFEEVVLNSDVTKYFTKEEIKQMFNKEYYLKEIDKVYNKLFQEGEK